MNNGKYNVTVAENAGFCFGVKRATDQAEALADAKSQNTINCTLGKLIHNDVYNKTLADKGMIEISREDIPNLAKKAEAGATVNILIRAHGEVREVIELLENYESKLPTFHVLNCTCPFVEKLRSIVRENSGSGKFFILFGDSKHPEVKGAMSEIRGDGTVIADSEELRAFLQDEKNAFLSKLSLSAAAQTTFDTREWKNCLKIIKKLYTNAKIFDTICTVTENRQSEAAKLAENSDAVIVIGSSGSSNTSKLYDICASSCKNTYRIDSLSQLPELSLRAGANISITAGASTPYSVIQEVKQAMNEQTENFAELLETSIKTLNTGEIVDGYITSISPNEVHVDLGAKTTGVITREKLTDDPSAKLDELFKVGDVVRAKVVKVSDIDGIATLDKLRVDADKNWDEIAEAAKTDKVFEGKVVEAVKGGVVMSVNSVRVFIPASQTTVPKDGDLSTLVGTTQRIMIIDIKPERKRAYGSIRAVARAERKVKEEAFWNEIEVGKVYTGTVRSLTSFGAFVDLGGVDGMVHLTELSWLHIKKPADVVSVGDTLTIFVKSFDREKNRISLGYKTEETNPWNIFTNQYSVGSVASCKIVSLMPFGAFAEILPGVDGLIHISQIAREKIAKPADVLELGQQVDCKITDIDYEKHKISLSIRALLEEDAPAEAPADDQIVYSTDNPSAYEGSEE